MQKLKESQQAQVYKMLKEGKWVCTSYMYKAQMADPRARLFELRESGRRMDWRWCETHIHNGHMKEWRLL